MKPAFLVLAVLFQFPLAADAFAADTPTAPSAESKAYIENAQRIAQITDEQKQSLARAFADYEKELKEFMTRNISRFQSNGQALLAAQRTGDKEALAAAQQENAALRGATNAIYQRFVERRDNVLTPAQRAKLAAAVDPTLIELLATPIKLTPAQIQGVQEKVGISDPATVLKKISEAVDQVLTPEQALEMKKVRAMKLVKKKYETAYLKPDQKRQIDAACDDLAKDPKLDAAALAAKLIEKLESVLTPEEKKSLLQPKD